MDKTGEIDQEFAQHLDEFWSEYCEVYEKVIENATIQSSTILYSMTHANSADKICEVGVGCGKSARMFIAELMKDGAIFFASDISKEMNETFAKRFLESDSALNPKVGFKAIKEDEAVNFDELVEELGEDKTRKIFNLPANNESLPYPDQYFDCYVCSLSLQIVNNHHNQLAEAHRVLKEGGVAGFTVWGRKENSKLFTLMPGIFTKLGLTPKTNKRTSHFHLNDKDSLERDVKNAGFSEVKLYYSPHNILFNSGEEMFQFYFESATLKPAFNALTDEQLENVKQETLKEFDTQFGKDTSVPITWEILV